MFFRKFWAFGVAGNLQWENVQIIVAKNSKFSGIIHKTVCVYRFRMTGYVDRSFLMFLHETTFPVNFPPKTHRLVDEGGWEKVP